MKRNFGRILSRGFHRGLKIVSISVLGSLVAFCSPQALCHVMAAGPVRFTTYLMVDENGEFATDAGGEYIQLFDEKGNLLAHNDDVKEFLKKNSDKDGNNKLAAKEKEFFLIDGKLYLDESGSEELADLSVVMPSIFKYDIIDSGYTLEAGNGTVFISPLQVNGDSVYVARVAGDYQKLPAFTISEDGNIGYFERGSVLGNGSEISFVYDSNYFYDENLNQIDNMSAIVPGPGDESAPMFTGYYIKNGSDRRLFVDVDGAVVMSPDEYRSIIGDASIEPEYCYTVNLNADGADTFTIYSDTESGSLYSDYRKEAAFENLSGDMLSQLSYENNTARGHFAGFYSANEESTLKFIDSAGNLTGEDGEAEGNRDYFARFYHVITADGGNGGEIFYSDGKTYSDSELTTEVSNIADITGGIPEDYTEDVHSDEKEMDGITTRYFIGYYFASDFGADEEADEKEMLLSEYEEEGFDPSAVEINKVKFADRDGNIVFNHDEAPSFDGDMAVYQNWYTVTVWDDGEVEIGEEADEKKADEETDETKLDEDTDETKLDEDTEKTEEPENPEDVIPEEEKDAASTEPAISEPAAESTDSTAQSTNSEEGEDKNKEGIEEDAKPNDDSTKKPEGSDSGDDGDDGDGGNGGTGRDGSDNSGTDEKGVDNTGIDMNVPKSEDETEGN